MNTKLKLKIKSRDPGMGRVTFKSGVTTPRKRRQMKRGDKYFARKLRNDIKGE